MSICERASAPARRRRALLLGAKAHGAPTDRRRHVLAAAPQVELAIAARHREVLADVILARGDGAELRGRAAEEARAVLRGRSLVHVAPQRALTLTLVNVGSPGAGGQRGEAREPQDRERAT